MREEGCGYWKKSAPLKKLENEEAWNDWYNTENDSWYENSEV